jgi:hypothetical protein
MEYPELYLEWVEYLVDKKLYGAWIKDVSTYVTHQSEILREQRRCYEDGDYYFMPHTSYTYTLCGYDENTVFTAKNVFSIIYGFNRGEDGAKATIQYMALGLKNLMGMYRITGVHWTQVYKEFYDKKHPKVVVLSRKLSKKLYRSANKVSSGKHYYSCCEDQPWYDKSYEKNKFSKKAWRK